MAGFSIKDKIDSLIREPVGEVWDVVSGGTMRKSLREQYFKSLSFIEPNTGIPDQIKDAYDAALKKAAGKLWKSTLSVAASGFGKGVLAVAAIVIVGALVLSGTGLLAPATLGAYGGTTALGQALSYGLSTAGNFLLGSGFGLSLLGIGGALGAVSDARKYHNRVTADIAAQEVEKFARAREENLAKKLELLESQGAGLTAEPAKQQEPQKETPNPFSTREMLRRQAQTANPYRGV